MNTEPQNSEGWKIQQERLSLNRHGLAIACFGKSSAAFPETNKSYCSMEGAPSTHFDKVDS